MLVVVSGSREWEDKGRIEVAFSKYITENSDNVTIIHGGCRGLDILAKIVAKERGYKVIEVPADWKKYGPSAGPIRNRVMLDMKPDLVLFFHDDLKNSKGTKDLVNEGRRRKLNVVCGN